MFCLDDYSAMLYPNYGNPGDLLPWTYSKAAAWRGLLGEWVMEELHALDQVAYVRFASVYRRFKDLSEFAVLSVSVFQ